MRPARMFLAVEATVFAIGALVHAGVFGHEYEHRQARIAESLIASVLALGLIALVARPGWTYVVAIPAQTFALVGTFIAVVMTAIGIGPRSVLDVVLQASTLALLGAGLVTAARDPRRPYAKAIFRTPMPPHSPLHRQRRATAKGAGRNQLGMMSAIRARTALTSRSQRGR